MSKKPLGIRLDPGLIAAAQEAARLENRTLTNLIETLLKERCGKALNRQPEERQS